MLEQARAHAVEAGVVLDLRERDMRDLALDAPAALIDRWRARRLPKLRADVAGPVPGGQPVQATLPVTVPVSANPGAAPAAISQATGPGAVAFDATCVKVPNGEVNVRSNSPGAIAASGRRCE